MPLLILIIGCFYQIPVYNCVVLDLAFLIPIYTIVLMHLKKLRILNELSLDINNDYIYYNKSYVCINKVLEINYESNNVDYRRYQIKD